MPSHINDKLNSEELSRYSRHLLLEEIGLAGQERLKRAKALVVGAGGLGSPVALYLAAAGVGTIGIADFDTVEAHNLQRQIIHRQANIHQRKTESARDAIKQINPFVNVRLHEAGVQPSNAVSLFAEYDIIIDGCDNFASRYLNNDAAFLAQKPIVYGSVYKFEGQASLFHPSHKGPCYRCLFPEPPPAGSVPNCGEAGVMGALCGIIGSIQAMETIKFLTGIGETLLGKLLILDTRNMSFQSMNLRKAENCPLCGPDPKYQNIVASNYQDACNTSLEITNQTDTHSQMSDTPIEIDVKKTCELMKNEDVVLLDVREKSEREICTIENSVHIPMGEIPARLAELPSDKHILVHCHHGGRSMRVVQFLRENGFQKSTNVGGGIDAWSVQIDQNLARY